eukprot:SAG31_NODE_10392_length_1144_cov_0.749282_2_plen_124_part_00
MMAAAVLVVATTLTFSAPPPPPPQPLLVTANLTLYVLARGGTSSDNTSWSPTILADALGAAYAAIESALGPDRPPKLPSARHELLTRQVKVEVNTFWGPFSSHCTVLNRSQVSATWTCHRPGN